MKPCFQPVRVALFTLAGAFLSACPAKGQVVDRKPLQAIDNPPAGQALFEELKADRTGVRFENRFDHPEAWTRLATQYFLGTIGTGIAIGDFDGNGLADIYAVGKDSPNALYLNRGGFRFEDVTEAAGVAGGSGFGAGVSVLDLENDGDLDLYVCYVGSPNELYVNQGEARFREAANAWGLDVDTGSNVPSFADYDRDGDLDLYLQCNYLQRSGFAEGMPDRLFRNEGGRFVEVTEQSGISGYGQGHAAVWWDFNEDGWPDLYVANDFAPADKLYRNNGDGTFEEVAEQALNGVPYSSMGADLGDINNDGHIDLFAAEMAARDIVKQNRTTGMIANKLVAAPKNQAPQYMKNMLSVKFGLEQYVEVSYLAGLDATNWTWAPRLADLDNDGWLDAYVTNGMARAFHDADIGYRAERVPRPQQRMALFKASPVLEERNLAFRNEGGLRFSETGRDWGLDKLGVSFAAAFGDLDNDGDLDLVANGLEPNLTIYRNGSGAGNRLIVELEGVTSNRFGVGALVTAQANGLRQTRKLALHRGYLSNDEPMAHFAFPDAAEVDWIAIEWPSGKLQRIEKIATGYRYRVREQETPAASRVGGGSKAFFQPASIAFSEPVISHEDYFKLFPDNLLVPLVETHRGPALEVGDFNGDGWEDLAVGGGTGQSTRVFLNQAGESFAELESDSFEDDFYREDADLVSGDFDGDGDVDLFVSAGGYELDLGDRYYEDTLYVNYGRETFKRDSQSLTEHARTSSRAALSLEDGRAILAWGGPLLGHYPETEPAKLYGLSVERVETGKYRELLQVDRVADALAIDLDGDGRNEIALAREWEEVELWELRNGHYRRRERGLGSGLRGVWSCLAAGDFDGNGLVDLAAGNLGDNTRYRATAVEPVTLRSPKRGSGRAGAFILGKRFGEKEHPLDSVQLLRPFFPELFDIRKTTFSEYAEMSVEEMFPRGILMDFERYSISETSSGIFFQVRQNVFEFVPLPGWGQSGVARDLGVLDVNGDGLDDLILALEHLPAAPWLDRRHTGHVAAVLGDAERRLSDLNAFQSGLETDGRPTSLALADFDQDGQDELVIGQSEGELLIYERID